MITNIIKRNIGLLAIVSALGLLLALPADAQYTSPHGTPPSNNIDSPLNIGSTAQSKLGGLILNSGGAQYGLLVPLGSVGIDTLVPASTLSVAGGVQVSADLSPCTVAKAGTIRWNSSSLEICSNSSWAKVTSASLNGLAVGSITGYGESLLSQPYQWGGGAAITATCSNASSPAWCDVALIAGYQGDTNYFGCGTGYTRVIKNQWLDFGYDYNWHNLWTCSRSDTNAIPAACPAAGVCATGPDGAKCGSFTSPFGPGQCRPNTSTCTNGAWVPSAGSYKRCTVVPVVYGCTDPTARNYMSNANTDNGSCQIVGCMQSSATNYNPKANIAGICSGNGYGCTNRNAINYDPTATIDNATCVARAYGCTDPNAVNYDGGANTDNGSCSYSGCTNQNYDNYNPKAQYDDGSCQNNDDNGDGN